MHTGGSNTNPLLRDYRKGNWTLQETMVLIEAKKMDNERRMKNSGKPSELRWKWVEDYCWKNGCLRSQNQCNDKWDNLMRDFKKVREYEKRVEGGSKSYWKIEKNERKENHLPSSMLPQVYQALLEVVDRKVPAVGGSNVPMSGGFLVQQHHLVAPLQQIPVAHPSVPVVEPLPPPPQGVEPSPSLPCPQPVPAVGTLFLYFMVTVIS